MEESLHGIVNVKAFTNEQYEKRRYAGSLSDFIDLTMSAAKARAFFVSFIIFALFGVITFVVWYGAGMLSDGEISSEKFTRFVLFSIFVGAAMGSFPEIMSQLYKAVGATERIREILSEKDENKDGTELIELEMKGGIEINDLSFCYPSRDEVVVLDDISFSVQPGERVAIVGASHLDQIKLFFYQINTWQNTYKQKQKFKLYLGWELVLCMKNLVHKKLKT